METKKLKKSTIIGYVMSILCILACLYITIEVIISNNEERPPRIFGLSVSYVPTESMEPVINAGDYILFVQASYDDCNVDDIIVYKSSEGKFIIHEIIEEHEDYFITKGCNNVLADDEKVTKDMVYGKYITTLGFMSIFSGGISKNLIFFILVIIFILMIVMQVFSMFVKGKTDELKKSKEEEKSKLIEELKLEVYKEELARLKALRENQEKEEETNKEQQ